MTTLNFREMMKEARKNASSQAKPSSTGSEAGMEPVMEFSPQSPVDDTKYIVDRFKYDMSAEIADFHQKYSEWSVGSLEHVYYIPNFVSSEEEADLLSNINSQPDTAWTQLRRRRLQNWGGIPASEGMEEEPLPIWLDSICTRLGDENFLPKRPNHALINEYKGDEGISGHKDGPVYFPRVIILSLGGSTSMTFRDRLRDPTHFSSLLIRPRSLLVFTKDAYTDYFHEIPVQSHDKIENHCINCTPEEIGQSFLRSTRTSITLRVVPCTKTKA